MSADCPRCGYSATPAIKAWTLTIAMDTPTQNHKRGENAGAMRFRYKRVRDMLQMLVRAERLRGRVPKAKRLRRVRITRYYGGHAQRRDRINFAGGCKALLDSLVLEELLVDDSEDWVDDYYEQVRIDGKTRVEVLIEELATS
jgi:Holliday junction resolvase RusA-like endonuclease